MGPIRGNSAPCLRETNKYVETLVAETILGLLQRVAPSIDDVDRFMVTVRDADGTPIGQLEISLQGIKNCRGPRESTIARDRCNADVDTLGVATAWVEVAEPVMPAGPKLPSL